MKISCPACRKVNESSTQCSRCAADLEPLVRVRRAASLALRRGSQALRQNDAPEALRRAEISWRLKRSTEAARLAFLACLHLQRFEAATAWYARAVAREG